MSHKCEGCGTEVKVVGKTTLHYEPVNDKSAKAVREYNIPFKCNLCGSIYLAYRPIKAVVWLWLPPAPEKVGSFYIPEYEGRLGNARDLLSKPYGIVLAKGPGAVHEKTGRLFRTDAIEVGDVVFYNKELPPHWRLKLPALDGKEYEFLICGYLDIWFRCN